MNLASRFSLLTFFVVATAFLPAELQATSAVGGRMGATSSASIRIEASVAPRLAIRTQSGAEVDRTSGVANPFCVWSSAPLRQYTMTLVGTSAQLRSAAEAGYPSPRAISVNGMRVTAGRPIYAIARSSIAECMAGGRDVNLTLDTSRDEGGSNGPVMLILAPE